MTIAIPDTHHDLLVEPIHGVLSTMMPDEQPQSCMVWVDYDGKYVLISTSLERQKSQNMKDNPKVGLLVIDPKDTSRWIQVRGTVAEIAVDVGEEFVDKLTRLYTNNDKQHYYGDIFPVEQKQKETRIIIKIEPMKISTDAIFK